jgi:hypothetical protein
MAEQVPMDRFEVRLADLLLAHTAVAAGSGDASRLAATAIATTPASDRGRWPVTLDRRLAWTFVALAALLALMASIALVGSMRQDDRVTREDDPVLRVLPAEIPADVPHGEIDTPIGHARWIHLTGDPTTLPDPLVPMAGPSGLIWFDNGWTRNVPCEDPEARTPCTAAPGVRLWTSDDALGPRVEQPLPVSGAPGNLMANGDTYWLTSDDPAGLWHTNDLRSWDEVDLTGLVSPGPSGLDWQVTPGVQATMDGVTVVSLTWHTSDLGRLVGHPGVAVHIESAGPGRYRVLEHRNSFAGGERVLGYVLIATTADGIRISEETGATIAELAGADLGFVEGWAASNGVLQQVALVDRTRLTVLDGPWSAATLDAPAILPVGSGLVALQVDRDRTVRAWRSVDGRTWTDEGLLGSAGGGTWSADAVDVVTTDGRPTLRVVLAGAGDAWTSSDGERWDFVAGPPADGPPPGRLGSGWLLLKESAIEVSRDGVSWEAVPQLERVITKWTTDGQGSTPWGTLGDAVFYAVAEESGAMERDLWVVEWDGSR